MSTVITVNDASTDTTTPTLVLGYESSRESRNVVHDLIGGGIAVTLIEPRPRKGSLELFYLTETTAAAALELHTRETSYTLTSTDRASISMTYVVDGAITIRLDDEGRRRWVVTVGYQEVIA